MTGQNSNGIHDTFDIYDSLTTPNNKKSKLPSLKMTPTFTSDLNLDIYDSLTMHHRKWKLPGLKMTPTLTSHLDLDIYDSLTMHHKK